MHLFQIVSALVFLFLWFVGYWMFYVHSSGIKSELQARSGIGDHLRYARIWLAVATVTAAVLGALPSFIDMGWWTALYLPVSVIASAVVFIAWLGMLASKWMDRAMIPDRQAAESMREYLAGG